MERWDRAGRFAAYGAALALLPYALIKVSWVVGALAGLLPVGAGFGLVEWVALNTVTVGMAGIGITVALALARPWGMRIPGPLVAFVAWVATGLLVPLLPYAVLDSLLGSADGGSGEGGGGGDGPSMPGWEAALIQVGFVGMGLGLAVALPAYLRRRWPDAFAERAGGGAEGSRLAAWVVAGGAVIGLAWLYWAAGGAGGVAHPDERNAHWRALNAVCGLWGLAASAAAFALTRAGCVRLPRWVPMAVGWLGSGSLFAWSGWKLPLTLYVSLAKPDDAALPEDLAVAVVLRLAAVVVGAAMMRILVRSHRRTAGG
ncbi:hypothetical protein [Streptomyces sp. TS71-3]|uniref:hypothetical protein n=1 Tax=Streptomyces sp. TS71-3 TaxID=2733862 RepID=UPI001B0B0AB6|nr:hypothetical protein [Streptomyces sp. TS71-3]GHJ39395.1 hypothetical protein Sm713_50040 [Streptomyces sp. TS71-3]